VDTQAPTKRYATPINETVRIVEPFKEKVVSLILYNMRIFRDITPRWSKREVPQPPASHEVHDASYTRD
jgi:hypothetical protein